MYGITDDNGELYMGGAPARKDGELELASKVGRVDDQPPATDMGDASTRKDEGAMCRPGLSINTSPATDLARDLELHLAWCDKFGATVSSVIIRSLLAVIKQKRDALGVFMGRSGDSEFDLIKCENAAKQALAASEPLKQFLGE